MAPTDDQLQALERVFQEADGGDHGGAKVCQRLLLGLYNGRRFPFDLTDLRRLDLANFDAALKVLAMDYQPSMEIHVTVSTYFAKSMPLVRLIFERWGYDQGLKGRCKKADLDELKAAFMRHNATVAA